MPETDTANGVPGSGWPNVVRPALMDRSWRQWGDDINSKWQLFYLARYEEWKKHEDDRVDFWRRKSGRSFWVGVAAGLFFVVCFVAGSWIATYLCLP